MLKTVIEAVQQKRFQNGLGIGLIAVLMVFVMYFYGSQLARHSVWLDESRTAEIVRKAGIAEVYDSVIGSRPYPPLYFFITHAAMKVSNSEVGLRMPSVVFGALAVLGAFFMARALYGNVIGIATAVLFFFIPKILFHARDGNCYAMLAATTLWSSVGLWYAWKTQAARYWTLFVAANVLALGTHLFAFFHFSAQILSYLALSGAFGILVRANPVKGAGEYCRTHARFLWCTGGLILGLGLWLIIFNASRRVGDVSTVNYLSLEPFKIVFSATTWKFVQKNYMTYSLSSQIIFLQMTGLIYCLVADKKKLAFTAIHLLVPFVGITVFLHLTHPMMVSRYTVGIAPFLCMLAACSLGLGPWVFGFVKVKWMRPAGWCVSAVFAGIMVFHSIQYAKFIPIMRQMGNFEYWSGAANILKENYRKGDVVFVCYGGNTSNLEFYLKGEIPLTDIPRGEFNRSKLTEVVLKNIIGKARIWLLISHVKKDEPMRHFLDTFSVKVPLQSGQSMEVSTKKMGEQKLPGIELKVYQVLGKQVEG